MKPVRPLLLFVLVIEGVIYVALSLALDSWTWPIVGVVTFAAVQLVAYQWRTNPRR